ncbi:alpha/beta hydrolase family protein [Pelobacter propionicus]|uniref:Hemolysin-type calcium-binding region n=1 Tax=Pelobacter propionicus (strain DSM 2379 / NBRC 103807 / OttBd1) TaxID=338966 RepID=A1ARK7_PELPD|nr:hypothetical protein [Pelobacter propionicus]ABK99977.1 hypothetical protein Ppro_2371 [Pelobacter propionicus DSM 2379]
MSQLSELSKQSDLAFATYAVFDGTNTNRDALKKAGMTETQATIFLSKYKIIAQCPEDITGSSATVFEEISTGKRYLAVRGTESVGDLIVDGILALGFPSYCNPQFTRLCGQVSQWLANGTLSSGFSVTGHSLGGYLAVAIGTWFSGQANGVYTYNAPGLGSLVGNALDAFRAAFGLSNLTLVNGITNVRGTAGISLISGIGTQLSPPLCVETESSLNPVANHSIVGLTDSLAIANLFSKLDPSIDLATVNTILQSVSNTSGSTLEAALDSIRKLLGQTDTTPNNNRIQFYTNIYTLQNNSTFTALQGNVTIISLENKTVDTIINAASANNVANGIPQAYRYALKMLNPFIVAGADYSQFNLNGELDLYDQATGKGLSESWISDRAQMLSWMIQANTQDISTLPAITGDGLATIYSDWTSGKEVILRNDPIQSQHKVIFGRDSDQRDLIMGDNFSDRLYGGGGDDIIVGGKGDDYLEGGAGNDSYFINTGDGTDTIEDKQGDNTFFVNGNI